MHGDLKGVSACIYYILKSHHIFQANILVNNDYRAVLADFGLASVLRTESFATVSTDSGGTVRWMTPELLIPEDYGLKTCAPSKESDVYALGVVSFVFCPYRIRQSNL